MTLNKRNIRPALRGRLLAGVLTLGAAVAALPLSLSGNSLISTAQAQRLSFNISFDTFHDELASYGDWVYSDRWGMVWLPDVGPDFHPYYTDGRWEPTREYGWTWVSDYEWGDIPFHYGRWVDDPYDGWIWVPGYVWSPGWVVWRGSPRYMGWMPLPPDDDFLRGNENVSFRFTFGGRGFDDFDGYYGYASWYGGDYGRDRFARDWVFIDADRIWDRDYRPYAVRQPAQIYNVIRETRNVTNYTVVNNYIVNRSADSVRQRPGARQTDAPRPAAEVMRRTNFVRSVDAGRQVEHEALREAPRGRGTARSAPKPPEAVANNLSDRIKRRGGDGRLFTRDTVRNAPLPATPASVATPEQRDRGESPRASRPGPDRQNQERANQERANQNRANQERANQERANTERANQERASQERADRARADQDRADQQRRADEQKANQQKADDRRANEQRRADEQRQENDRRQAEDAQRRANQARANQERATRDRADDQRRAEEQRRATEQKANEQRASEQRANEQRANQSRAEEDRRAKQEREAQQKAPEQADDPDDERAVRGKARGNDGGRGRGQKDRD